jgi:hypothetical protein
MGIDWLPLVIVASLGFFAFFGGTMLILLSRRAPWKIRLRWTIVSLIAPLLVILIALLSPGKGEDDNGAVFFLSVFAVFVAVPANWMAYKKYGLVATKIASAQD